MKKLKNSLFVIGALLFAQSLHAQTVDEIVVKYIHALGGKEKLSSLKTLRMQGNLNVQGTDVEMTITKQHLIGSRADITVMGSANYQIVTQNKGTLFMPVQGMNEPMDMPDEQFKVGQTQLDIQSALLDYKEKGTAVELQGMEKVNGEDHFKLKLTFKNGIIATYFIKLSSPKIAIQVRE